MTWLAGTPVAVVRACLLMLPRLTAEESLVEAQRHSVGAGALKESDARGVIRHWTRTADVHRQSPRRRPPPATPGTLASMGIGYEVVKAD